MTADNIASYCENADGFIIGTAFKSPSDPTAPVDLNRVKHLIATLPQSI